MTVLALLQWTSRTVLLSHQRLLGIRYLMHQAVSILRWTVIQTRIATATAILAANQPVPKRRNAKRHLCCLKMCLMMQQLKCHQLQQKQEQEQEPDQFEQQAEPEQDDSMTDVGEGDDAAGDEGDEEEEQEEDAAVDEDDEAFEDDDGKKAKRNSAKFDWTPARIALLLQVCTCVVALLLANCLLLSQQTHAIMKGSDVKLSQPAAASAVFTSLKDLANFKNLTPPLTEKHVEHKIKNEKQRVRAIDSDMISDSWRCCS